jgi:hypothetical protein
MSKLRKHYHHDNIPPPVAQANAIDNEPQEQLHFTQVERPQVIDGRTWLERNRPLDRDG